MRVELKKGAWLIGDAHDGLSRDSLFALLKVLDSKKQLPPQLFFLGDMFDFLTDTPYLLDFYKKEIELIDSLSQKTELFYLEGNHDFGIKRVFLHAKVFENKEQPLYLNAGKKVVAMSHGDIFLPFITQKSLLFLRGKHFLKMATFLDGVLNFKLSKAILNSQKDKSLYYKIPNFKELISKKIENYRADIIIEGHYHQDSFLKFRDREYWNLNSYAVSQKIYEVEFKNGSLSLNSLSFSSIMSQKE